MKKTSATLFVGVFAALCFLAWNGYHEVKQDVAEEKNHDNAVEARSKTWKEQRAIMQELVDWQLDHEVFIILQANSDGAVSEATGPLKIFGWTKPGITGKPVSTLRPKPTRKRHTKAYERRKKEGQTGEIKFFDERRMLTENGGIKFVDTAVFWHHERGVFVSYIGLSEPFEE